jgi:hypothetical protein
LPKLKIEKQDLTAMDAKYAKGGLVLASLPFPITAMTGDVGDHGDFLRPLR